MTQKYSTINRYHFANSLEHIYILKDVFLSIKDLLDARDCDPEVVLVNLGFAMDVSGESRKSVSFCPTL